MKLYIKYGISHVNRKIVSIYMDKNITTKDTN